MVKGIITLIRWKNLLITAGLIFVLKFLVFDSAIEQLFPLSSAQFPIDLTIVLILSLMFLAAGGYVINDIYDVQADVVNKPEKVVIGHLISEKAGTILYVILTALGIGLGVYLGYQLGNIKIGLLHAVVAAIFWIYSAHLKGTVLVGNILIAFASSAVPLIYYGFEANAYINEYKSILMSNFAGTLGGPLGILLYYCGILSGFAFLLSLAREIIKDIEDEEGDSRAGCRTLPIVYGETVSKLVVQVILTAVIVLLVWLLHFKINHAPFSDVFFMIYCYATIIAPTGYLIYQIKQANSKEDFHTTSTIIKLIMVSGIGTALIYASNI